MKVTIFLIGKTEEHYLNEGINLYLRRLKYYLKVNWDILPNVKQTLQPDQLRAREGEALLKKIKPADLVILLDEKGKGLTSNEFSDFISVNMNSGMKSIVIIVGGAYGVSDQVRGRADFILALSKMTFSHQMVRLILVEQLYRAMTIIKGEKYHHD